MGTVSPSNDGPAARILEAVRRYWGFERLRPLQEQAIVAGIERRDSLVVMPTGGGKSLCYQVPPVVAERTDVVVSPLIALMKDQVDGLRECGYPAAALHSNMTPAELNEAERQIAAGTLRLIFVAPERLLAPRFSALVQRVKIGAFAIDEAHCISHWGHDFRPEYRQLATLKERFAGVSVHAYTATATPRVREDIANQLRLKDPAILVGTFDRANLAYRVVPRIDVHAQALAVVRRHDRQACIVYCISRRDAEEMAEVLIENDVKAAAYHAGMDAASRRKTQDAFAEERIDVVTATVAFGMGIDRSDVRCVIHAAMPKSIEHYQQETGRAGRDGLEAECVLFYSAGDAQRWRKLMENSAGDSAAPDVWLAAMRKLLDEMQNFAAGAKCRHRALSEYFGQAYERETCGACDVCLNEMEPVADSTVVAQKILSCVYRVGQRLGAKHVVDVLLGANTERIRELGHDQLSTYGLLKGHDRKVLSNLIHQLVDQGLLERTEDEFPVLRLCAGSWTVLKNERQVTLLQPKTGGVKRTRFDEQSWEGVDRELFERLREVRREIAAEHGVPAYLIFGDATLRELARVRPTSLERFRRIKGVGERKTAELGRRFTAEIAGFCRAHRIQSDVADAPSSPPPAQVKGRPMPQSAKAAYALFDRGYTIEQVMSELQRARTTTVGYLNDYIRERCPKRIDCWVNAADYGRIADAAAQVGGDRLKPIFERLREQVPYDTIRLVVTHLNMGT